MKCIFAVIIFVQLVMLGVTIVNNYHVNGFQYQHNTNQTNINPISSNHSIYNFHFQPIEFNNVSVVDESRQKQILEKLISLFVDTDNFVIKSSPAAVLARQRPFALVSPKPTFLRCISNCPTTNQYDPVCGTDHQTYHNEYKLQCAIRCGKRIQMAMIGICPLNF